jgi:hypothetical protein
MFYFVNSLSVVISLLAVTVVICLTFSLTTLQQAITVK